MHACNLGTVAALLLPHCTRYAALPIRYSSLYCRYIGRLVGCPWDNPSTPRPISGSAIRPSAPAHQVSFPPPLAGGASFCKSMAFDRSPKYPTGCCSPSKDPSGNPSPARRLLQRF
ncbi:hypothetical protein F4801DRAFT_39356 [Xylaria longipes]|nr:hypothetical protein F4801DRAFT_39356 [Xylaria longipes]